MNVFRVKFILAVVLAGLTSAGCAAPAASPTPTSVPPTQAVSQATEETSGSKTTIVLADISDEPTNIVEDFQPLADYLAAHLNDAGIEEGIVTVAPDMESIAQKLESGEVDLYFDSPYPAMIVSDLSGAEPLLRRWKDGVSEYHSIIFSLASSEIDTVEDLQGAVIAFDEPYSTSGFMLPLAYLIEAGMTTAAKSNVNSEVADDEIGYVFSGDDDNAVQWVISGVVGAAVVDSALYASLPQETRDQLQVVAETEPLPRHVLVTSPKLDPAVRDAVRTVLTAMHESEEGQSVLFSFEETAQFDEFPGGVETALTRMRELFDMVQSQ